MVRRGWIPAVLVVVIAALAWGATRVLPRSPMTILLVCVLAVFAMKVVERRVREWLRAVAAREQQRREKSGGRG